MSSEQSNEYADIIQDSADHADPIDVSMNAPHDILSPFGDQWGVFVGHGVVVRPFQLDILMCDFKHNSCC